MNATKLSLVSMMSFITAFSFAQYQSQSGFYETGVVNEGLFMESSILKGKVNFTVYLPPNYDKSTQKYPVLYLLHGHSDNEITWIQRGEIQSTLDRAIADRVVSPMIVIMPDAKVTWYINDYTGKTRYEDMIFNEFIPFIDKNYRTRTERAYRAIAGLSMGGYGSLIWSLHHPDVIGSCAAYSSGIFEDEDLMNLDTERYNNYYKGLYGSGTQENRITEHWKKNSVIELMSTLPKEHIGMVKFYIDCGDDDSWSKGNSLLHIVMIDRNIYHEYRVKDGSHNWIYWRTNIIEGLIFISRQFTQAPSP